MRCGFFIVYNDYTISMAYVPHQSVHRTSRPGSQAMGNFFSRIKKHFRKMNRRKVLLYSGAALVGLILFGYIASLAVFAYYGRQIPSPGRLSESRGNSTVFYDRNGKVIYEMFKDKNRVPVKSDDISPWLKKATVAIEDKHFYEHSGISEIGILRAAIFSAMGQSQGGSTITQQLIKNVLLTNERSLSRKVKEAILAYQVEKRYTKDEILTMYLNEAPYGGTYWGVGTASRAYFNKPPKDLTIVEAAILAGIPQRPTTFSPHVGRRAALENRTIDVLRRMREDKYITPLEEKLALTQLKAIKFSKGTVTDIPAAHFVFYLRDKLVQQYGEGLFNQGMKIKTTLDLDIQEKAQKIVKDEIAKLEKYQVSNGASVVLDVEKGEILAYVGSHDYNDEKNGQFDVISQGDRQPGSTLKPIEYAAMMEKGYTASSVIMDTKTVFPNPGAKDYVPENYDLRYRGPVQIRFALANSLNVTAVKGLAMIGLRDFLQKAYDMGINSLEPTNNTMQNLGLSASLGGGGTNLLDLTSAYTVFARGGERIDSAGILEITEFNGKQIYKKKDTKSRKVLSPEISFIISHILSDNIARQEAFGPRSELVIPGKTVAAKTGTTNDKRDNYTVGFTKSVAVGVWVGNNDNSKMNEKIASGLTGASPIWHDIMVELLKKYPDNIMEKPAKVKALQVDSFLGGLPKDSQPTRSEYFVEGTEPKDISPFYKKVKISRSTGKLANEVEIRSNSYEEKEFVCFTENDPVSADGKNRWQEAINEWVSQQKDDRLKCPTETSDASSEDVVVSIKSPGNNAKVDSNSFEVKVKIGSLHPIKKVQIYASGREVKTLDGDRNDVTETIRLDDGVYDLKVVAINDKDKTGDSTIKIGVNRSPDAAPPSPTSAPLPTTAPPTSAPPTTAPPVNTIAPTAVPTQPLPTTPLPSDTPKNNKP